jgi:hypothetical protein
MKIIRTILLFTITLLGAEQTFAAIVETQTQRLEAKITAQDEKSVTLTGETGNVLVIPRSKIVAIYDDAGNEVWRSGGTPESNTFKSGIPLSEQKPFFAANSIIIDFYVGTALGGFYSEEKKFMDALGIYVQYADGSTQFASNSFLSFGVGVNYQTYSSLRWSSLFSYVYRSTMLQTSVGDGQKYENKVLGSEVSSRMHALFWGKELHLYPGDGGSSFDFIGQIGYELGNYRPLATYNSLRTQLSPVPAQYIGVSSVFVHGPTARLGTGITFRGSNFQLRLQAYYQFAYTLASDQIWNAVSKGTALHDIYGGISLGYGW